MTGAIEFGLDVGVYGRLATPGEVLKRALLAEDEGFHSVWLADHIVFPATVAPKYPYSLDGNFPAPLTDPLLEPIATMGVLVGATKRVKIGTAVLVMPLRNPVLLARMLATLDVFSNGRIILGAGVGWMAEEFAALNAPDFAKRGAVSNEYLEIFAKLWAGGPVSHQGEFYQFDEVRCEPLPVQRPGPPIWVGGHSRAALRRAARYGDGWHPVGANAAVPLPPDEMAVLISELKQLTVAEGRDFDAMALSFKAPLYDTAVAQPDGARRPFTGSNDQVIEDIHTYANLGIEELIFDIRSPSLSESLERMEHFAADIMAPAEA